MPGLKTRVKYTSEDTAPPFRVTAVVGAETASLNSRGWYYLVDAVDETVNALVEATLTSTGLWVDAVAEDNAPNLYFSNGVILSAAFDDARFNTNLGGMKGILLIGQSNMVGHNGTSVDASSLGYDPILDVPNASILQYRKSPSHTLDNVVFATDDPNIEDKFVLATEPLDHAQDLGDNEGNTRPTSTGCGLTFAKQILRGKYSHTNARLCLLPCAKGGTGIISSGNAWAAPSGTMYLYARTILNEFYAAHPDNEMVAIAFQQGETDALTSTVDPGEWQAAGQILLDAFRDGTGITFNAKQTSLAKVPFILGGIKETGTSNSINVKADQIALADANPYCEFAGVDGSWTYFEFGLHTDAPGQRERGLLLYEAYLKATGVENRKYMAQRPIAMVNPAIVEAETELTVSWDATTDDAYNVQAVIDYQLQIKETSQPDSSYSTAVVKNNATFTHTFTGLTNGTSYDVRLVSRSAVGFSNESVLTETPLLDVVPTAPASFAVSDQPTGIQLDWTAQVFDPVVTSYVIQVRETGVGTFGVEIADIPIASQATDTYLYTVPSTETDYDFRMLSINSIGSGPYTSILTQSHVGSPVLAAGATLWLRAGVGETADATYPARMETWVDQSDSSTSVTHPTTATYEDDTPLLNGGDGARFGNKDGWYLGAGGHFDATPGFTIVIECTIPVLEDQNVFYGIRSHSDLRQNGTAGAIEFGTASSNTGLLVAATRVIWAMSLATDGSASFYKYSGGTATAWGTGTRTYMTAPADRVAIGCRPYLNDTLMQNAYGLEGDMHNIAMFPSVLSLSDINAVMEAL